MPATRPPATGPSRRALAAVTAAALAVVCGACSSPGDRAPGPPPPTGAGEGGSGVVERVVDGDTLIARIGGVRVRVRLIGVDAPERSGYGSAECYGPEAADEARRLLPEGARVRLVTDGTQGPYDRFGRRLAEVTRAGGGRTVNEALIGAGAAEVFRGDGRARLLPALFAAERAARDAGRGLWSACRGG
jgi:micrococcal nuclease